MRQVNTLSDIVKLNPTAYQLIISDEYTSNFTLFTRYTAVIYSRDEMDQNHLMKFLHDSLSMNYTYEYFNKDTCETSYRFSIPNHFGGRISGLINFVSDRFERINRIVVVDYDKYTGATQIIYDEQDLTINQVNDFVELLGKEYDSQREKEIDYDKMNEAYSLWLTLNDEEKKELEKRLG